MLRGRQGYHSMKAQLFDALNAEIVSCESCPRLRTWCEAVAVEKRRAFKDENYWGKPVPNFGDPEALGLIVGLAPAAHGANRTGRMFTGDRSGDWLYSVLHEAGLANQPESVSGQDGLTLNRVLVTAVCHCAPPDNKPTPDEVTNCRTFLDQTIRLRPFKAVLCLGAVSWRETMRALSLPIGTPFFHGCSTESPNRQLVLGSYHPSQQNTFTGRLTRPMLLSVVQSFADALSTPTE